MTFPLLAAAVAGIAAGSWIAARVTKQYAIVAVAAGALILWLHGWVYFEYTSDDAYISYRYARNLADGIGPVWNPGERVEGYSNFLWTAVLAGFDRTGAEPVRTGRWLGFALGVASLGGTYALARVLLAEEAGRIAGLIAVILLAASGPFALWASAGLETSLFAALALAAALLHIREHARGGAPLSGAIWAFAAMTRPDALLLVAVSGLFKFVSILAALRDGRTDVFRALGNALLWTVAFAVLFAPYFAWRYAYYDEMLPNTYYAKVGSGLDQYERGLYHFAIFAREHAAWLLAMAPLAIAIGGVRRPAALHVLALLLAWFAYVTYIGGDSLVRFRFFAPLLPLMYALVASSGIAIVRAVRMESAPRFAVEAAGVIAAGALLMFTLQSSATDGAIAPEREAVGDRAEIGRWLRASVPETTLIAVIPAGAIPYESRLHTIDMLGINDKHIAHRDLDLGTFGAGHEKYDSQYVLDRQPDIIILMDTLAERAWRREDYDVLRGGIIPARIDMLSTPRLWEEYEARAVRLREGAWLNLLVRREASAVREKTQAP